MRTLKPQVCVLFLFVLILASTAHAQSNTGIVRGTVTDQSGAAIAGATVTLANPLTNYTQTAAADSRGAYQLIDVPFGRYKLSFEAAQGFAPTAREINVNSNLTQRVDAQLGVAPVSGGEVKVESRPDLLNAEKTAPSVVIDRNRIESFPSSQPSRSTEEIIATAPGWTLDANRRLHARGIEYQVQYSMDGIPVTDTIAATFGSSPDPDSFRSVEISTANIPAEYGNKLAGVVAVNTRSGLELSKPEGNVSFSGGSFSTYEGSFNVGGRKGKFGYFLGAAGSRTNRFLDPPALENFNNRGTSGKSFLKLDYAPNENNLVRFNFALDGQRFRVPNLPFQEEAGQDQRRSTNDNSESVSWQHTFSPNLVGNIAAFQRYNSAKLSSNALATPVFAEQSRHNSTQGLLGSLTYNIKRNTIKTGFELTRFPVTESFTFAITDLDALLEKQPDLTEEAQEFTLVNPFLFNDRRTGREGSFYIQDHINATRNLTLDVGARFDSYHFLVTKNYLSPRLGAAYFIPRTKTVLRASYNRFLETPALENLLLSSSAQSRIFSPAEEEGAPAFAPVRTSRESQFDVGFEQQLSRYVRFDADFYSRRLNSPPEITNFFETGIIFPANLSRSRSRGLETRLDVARVRGFSGYVSYTNFHIYGFAPITGGLFLGEAVDSLRRAGERIRIEEDQRNTAVFETRYDRLPGRFYVAFGGRHDSGYSVELDPDVTRADFANEFPAKILDQVNFERGFVKPRTVFNLYAGKEFALSERVRMLGQVNVENLFDRFYLITFESVFSGTAIGRPRSVSGRLSFNFK